MMSRFFRRIALALTLGLAAPALSQGVPLAPVAPTSDADVLAAQMRVLAANPSDLYALTTAGELTLKMGDTTAAGVLFARAERVDPRNGRLKADRGSLLLRTERPGEALRLFAQAEALGWPAARLAAEQGLAYDLIGENERAQRDYRLALKTSPDDETVRRYALSLGIAGNRTQAEAVLDPLLRRSDRAAWRDRAFILAMTGDPAGAERIATSMMPGAVATGLAAFFPRLATMPAVDRAFAVTFGEMRPSPERLADRGQIPVLPPLGPDPDAKPVVAQVAVAPPVPDRKHRHDRKSQLAQATAQPLPADPRHAAEADTQVAPGTVAQAAPAIPLPTPMRQPAASAYQPPLAASPATPLATPTPSASYPGPPRQTYVAPQVAVTSPPRQAAPVIARAASAQVASAATTGPTVPLRSATSTAPAAAAPVVVRTSTYTPTPQRSADATIAPSTSVAAPPASTVPAQIAPAQPIQMAELPPSTAVPAVASPGAIAGNPAIGHEDALLGQIVGTGARPPAEPAAPVRTIAPVPAISAPAVAAPVSQSRPPVTQAAAPALVDCTSLSPARRASVRCPSPAAHDTNAAADCSPRSAGGRRLKRPVACAADRSAVADQASDCGPTRTTHGRPSITPRCPALASTTRTSTDQDCTPRSKSAHARPVRCTVDTALVDPDECPPAGKGARGKAAARCPAKEVAAREDADDCAPPRKGARAKATRCPVPDASDDCLPAKKGARAKAKPCVTADRASTDDADDCAPPRKGSHAKARPCTDRAAARDADDCAPPAKGSHAKARPCAADSRSAREDADACPPMRKGAHGSASTRACASDDRAAKDGGEDDCPPARSSHGRHAAKGCPADAAKQDKPRIWVQVAGGATEGDLAKAWAKTKAQAPGAFKGRQGWTTPLRATNRVLAGPFEDEAAAQAFVNQLQKSGVSGFVFTSEAGQKVTRLPAGK